jgi:arylsulfatase A-like enzyme
MTGLAPHQHGMMGLAHVGWSLDDEGRALPWQLADAGYDTHLFGFQHETDWSHPERLGYESVHRADDGTGHPPAQALDLADRFAASLDDLASEAPFYANIGFVEPHRPFRRDAVPEGTYDRYEADAVDPLPYLSFESDVEREKHCRDLADFWSLVSGTVDPAMGTIRDALHEAGIDEDTVVVFTTDHGEAFERAKGTAYEPGASIALLVEGPDRFVGTGTPEAMVSNVDVFSTMLDVADAPIPDDVAGRSFRALLSGEEADAAADHPRDHVFCEQTWHVDCRPTRAVRTERYKYVRHFRPFAERRPGWDDGEPTRALYDLDADPLAQTNLVDPDAGVPAAHDAALGRLESPLFEHMAETDDPLASGCIPMPKADRIDSDESYPPYIAP